MINKDLRSINTNMFLSKLDLLLERLRVKYESGSYSTEQEVISEFLSAINIFYQDLKTPFLTLRPVKEGELPDSVKYNELFDELENDLQIAFRELDTLEKMVIKNFNYMVSERDKVNKLLKRVNSKVGDYILYVDDPVGDAIYFKDSFNDTSKIEYGSDLLTEKQCEIYQAEGIITLPPILDAISTLRKSNVRINNNSNGSNGNMYDLSATSPRNDIEDILDANPDTWFEYERVQYSKDNDDEPLLLDLTLYFNKPQVINFIRINPNNFGTQAPVKIEQIDTSIDGKEWVSIKDDVPISGFLQEDEDNIFTLAPSTSKYAGEGRYTFTPRKVKYVHVSLSQNIPYIIETTTGLQWRYAIGIRDIELHGIKYYENGDLISTPFSSAFEIQKVSLLASENPMQASELADITHQVSVDDGASWHSIQPQDRIGTEIPEILNFNTDDEGAIETSFPIYNIRHRMLLSRDSSQFTEGSSTFRKTVKLTSDIAAVPQFSPMYISLTRPPVSGTISVLNPMWGSRSDNTNKVSLAKRILGLSTGNPGMKFALPKEINDKIKLGELSKDDIIIWADNDSSFTRVGSFSGATDQYDKWYTLNIVGDEAILQFGLETEPDPSSAKGYVPPAGAVIAFSLSRERLLLSASAPYKANLVMLSDGDKKNFKITKLVETAKTSSDEEIIPGSTIHRLEYKYVTDGSTPTFTGDSTNVFQTKVTYVDGSSELDASGKYSIDYTNGIIYSYNTTPADSSITITYTYDIKEELTETDWDFLVGADNLYDTIELKPTGYSQLSATKDLTASASSRYVDLGKETIVPGSIVGITSSMFTGTDVVPKEVAFVDGRREFPNPGRWHAGETETDTSGYYSIDYRNGKMYLAGSLAASGLPTLSFYYTEIYAEYNIAKAMDETAYTVDFANNRIILDERESLKLWGDSSSFIKRDSLIKVIYQYVQTTRESIEELEPYFTPIVRDYVLKILPKG